MSATILRSCLQCCVYLAIAISSGLLFMMGLGMVCSHKCFHLSRSSCVGAVDCIGSGFRHGVIVPSLL